MMIALLTDFGLDDPYVGVMKAIILTIAPEAQVVDLTHAIPPQDVAAGAWALATAVDYLPGDAIVLAVVDPGVGTDRRPIAVQIDNRCFVAPDNGLLTRVLARRQATQAVLLDNPAMWRDGQSVSATFHGRDIFAPAAARLVHSAPLAALGSPIDPASLTRLPLPTPKCEGDEIIAHIIHIDHFGNAITDIGPDLAPTLFAAKGIGARLHRQRVIARAMTFGAGPPNVPFWYLDSSGHAAIAWRNGNAAQRLNITVGDVVKIRLRR
jgi:S-adenosyl-L-methionine hydrolase (adenosine-forming)